MFVVAERKGFRLWCSQWILLYCKAVAECSNDYVFALEARMVGWGIAL